MAKHGIRPMWDTSINFDLDDIPATLLEDMRQCALEELKVAVPTVPLGKQLAELISPFLGSVITPSILTNLRSLHTVCGCMPRSYLRALLLVDRPQDVLYGIHRPLQDVIYVREALIDMLKRHLDIVLKVEMYVANEREDFGSFRRVIMEWHAAVMLLSSMSDEAAIRESEIQSLRKTCQKTVGRFADQMSVVNRTPYPAQDLNKLYMFGVPVFSFSSDDGLPGVRFTDDLLRRLGSDVRIFGKAVDNHPSFLLAVQVSETEHMQILGRELARTLFMNYSVVSATTLGRFTVVRANALDFSIRCKYSLHLADWESVNDCLTFYPTVIAALACFEDKQSAPTKLAEEAVDTYVNSDTAGLSLVESGLIESRDIDVLYGIVETSIGGNIPLVWVDVVAPRSPLRHLIQKHGENARGYLLAFLADTWAPGSVLCLFVLGTYICAAQRTCLDLGVLVSVLDSLEPIVRQALCLLMQKTRSCIETAEYYINGRVWSFSEVFEHHRKSGLRLHPFGLETGVMGSVWETVMNQYARSRGRWSQADQAYCRLDQEHLALAAMYVEDALEIFCQTSPDIHRALSSSKLWPLGQPVSSPEQLGKRVSFVFEKLAFLWSDCLARMTD